MTRLRKLMASGASCLARVVLFIILVPSIMVAIQLIAPYEDARKLPIKVIKLDENNHPYLTWCCRGPDDGVVDHDRYLLVLKNSQGVIESGSSRSTYLIEMAETHDITIVLHSAGDVFVYDVRGARLYPVKRKVLTDAWKVIVSLVVAVLMVLLATQLVRIKGANPRSSDGMR